MDLIKLSDARVLGLRHYYTGLPCIRGHISIRQVKGAACMECKKEQQAERMKDPALRVKQSASSVKSYMKRRETNVEFRKKDNEYRKTWTAKKMQDPEYKARHNARAEELRKQNPIRHREKVARHKMAKLKRIPSWLSPKDRESIKGIYAMRDWLNMTMFGIKYEVDHIIPIRGAVVSGLHVPSNLQIIKAIDNAVKGSSYEMA